MAEHAPSVAIVDEDESRIESLAELLEASGFRAHGFTSPRSASSVACALQGFDVMLVEHGIRELSLSELQGGLERRLGARAPQLVVLTRTLHEMPIPERARYAAVLPRPVEVDTLLAALESAVIRHARAGVLVG